jgi:hypothetical protein
MNHKLRIYVAPLAGTMAMALCAVLIAGCTIAGHQDMTYMTDQRFPPKADSAPIEILLGTPTRPYIAIGDVTAYADDPLWTMPDAQTAVERLKMMARKMGGDAIASFEGRRAPAGTQAEGNYSAHGIVVRWR